MSLGPRLIDEISDFQKQVDKFFGGFNNQMDLYEHVNTPLTDFYEGKDDFKIVMNLPGIKKEEINIESDAESMEIRVNKEEIKEENKDKKYYIRERRIGKFMRRINFPSLIDPNKSKITLENGVLTVIVPKSEASKRIALKVE
jgi:HSP20 family protein